MAGVVANRSLEERKLVLVFDYDYSLINVNSDTYLFEELAPAVLEYIKEQSASRRGEWTAIVDEGLAKLQAPPHNAKENDILECLANVPVFQEMIECVRVAHQSNVPVFIVSDASEAFIGCFLEKNELQPLIEKVITNKSWYSQEDGQSPVLRVKPHHPEDEPPHGCPLCPRNLCKGQVLREHLDLLGNCKDSDDCWRVLYVGDGGGDFCAAHKLREHDVLFARDDPSVPSARGLVRRMEREKDRYPVRAQVVTWKEGKDVLFKVKEIIQEHKSLGHVKL
jgi:pyridoxal phosphate phosphatase PHOSPHO2